MKSKTLVLTPNALIRIAAQVDTESFEIIFEDVVNNARNGIGTVNSLRAFTQNFRPT